MGTTLLASDRFHNIYHRRARFCSTNMYVMGIFSISLLLTAFWYASAGMLVRTDLRDAIVILRQHTYLSKEHSFAR